MTCSRFSTMQPTKFRLSYEIARLSPLGSIDSWCECIKNGRTNGDCSISAPNHKTVSTVQTVNTTTSATVKIRDAKFCKALCSFPTVLKIAIAMINNNIAFTTIS